jgi:hypothetical protein
MEVAASLNVVNMPLAMVKKNVSCQFEITFQLLQLKGAIG